MALVAKFADLPCVSIVSLSFFISLFLCLSFSLSVSLSLCLTLCLSFSYTHSFMASCKGKTPVVSQGADLDSAFDPDPVKKKTYPVLI